MHKYSKNHLLKLYQQWGSSYLSWNFWNQNLLNLVSARRFIPDILNILFQQDAHHFLLFTWATRSWNFSALRALTTMMWGLIQFQKSSILKNIYIIQITAKSTYMNPAQRKKTLVVLHFKYFLLIRGLTLLKKKIQLSTINMQTQYVCM